MFRPEISDFEREVHTYVIRLAVHAVFCGFHQNHKRKRVSFFFFAKVLEFCGVFYDM